MHWAAILCRYVKITRHKGKSKSNLSHQKLFNPRLDFIFITVKFLEIPFPFKETSSSDMIPGTEYQKDSGSRNEGEPSSRFQDIVNFKLYPGKKFSTKKVTIVIPPSTFLLDERVFASLGALKVASSLESTGVTVNLLDLSGVSNYTEVVEKYFSEVRDSDWIGLSATTPQLPATLKITEKIREVLPAARIVLGGPHVTLCYSALKVEVKNGVPFGRARKAATSLEQIYDVLVAGDGEFIVFKIFDPNCPKVLDGDDPKSGYFMTDTDYESSPRPARHLVDMESYKYQIDGYSATSLIAQLGCPFGCGFCGGRNSKSLRLIRNRSIESIIQEMEWLYKKYGYRGFMFYDDELNVNKQIVKLMEAICDLQMRLGVDFRLRGFVKSELLTDEQVRIMKDAGFRWILCGFEAANQRILQNIDKIATIEDNTRAVELIKKHDLKVKALMSIGHPGESEQSVLDIQNWLINMAVDDFDCTIITTYPGTPYYDLAVPHEKESGIWVYTHLKTGDRLYAYELDYASTPDYYKGDPNGGYKSYVYTDYLTAEQIVQLRDNLERKVRLQLNIPFNQSRPSMRYEHSMGQCIPGWIYKSS